MQQNGIEPAAGSHSQKNFRVLLVGCGGISRQELGPLTRRADVVMCGLVDVQRERAAALATEFELTETPVFTDLQEALASASPDVVVDCTPPAAHRAVVTTALNHGCHVLGQKPLADTMENARAMLETARATDRQYGIIQTLRFSPTNFAMRDFLAAEPLGKLTDVDLRFFAGLHFPEGDFRRSMKHVLLIDMAIHHFDLVRMVSGLDPVSVYCQDWNPANSWFAHGASASAVFEMTGGVRFTYTGSWCTDCGTGLEWSLINERGTLTTRSGRGLQAGRATGIEGITSGCEDVPVTVPDLSKQQTGHSGAVNDFFDALRDDRPPLCPAEDNLKSFAMADAAVRSAETGERIEITF